MHDLKNKLSINLEVSLVEIILSVMIFAICGVVMLNCFFIARFTQIKANDKTMAVMKVQSALEYIKSSKSIDEMDEILKDTYKTNCYYEKGKKNIYVENYDDDWNECEEIDREYFMEIDISDNALKSGNIENISVTVKRVKPYPFINSDKDEAVISINSKKYFPNFMTGGSR